MNIGKYMQMYFEELQRKGYRKNSIDNYVNYTKVFLEKHNCIVEKPTEINERHIKDFLRGFKEHNTQRAYHSAIKTFY
jgi:hypothetical protein